MSGNWTGRGYRQRSTAITRADAYDRGYDPHPDDNRPPAQHLVDEFNESDWLGALQRSVEEARRLNAEDREEMRAS